MLTDNDLAKIGTIVKDNVRAEVKDQLKPVKKDIRKLTKTVSVMIDYFDRDHLKLKKRVIRIEDHLGIDVQ